MADKSWSDIGKEIGRGLDETLDIFTPSGDSGPKSGEGTGSTQTIGLGGNDNAGTSETDSKGTTRHYDNRGRLAGETERHGNRLYHYAPSSWTGLVGRTQVGFTDVSGNHATHYNNQGNRLGTSEKRDDGRVDTYDNHGNWKYTTHVRGDLPLAECSVSEIVRSYPDAGGGEPYFGRARNYTDDSRAVSMARWGIVGIVLFCIALAIWTGRPHYSDKRPAKTPATITQNSSGTPAVSQNQHNHSVSVVTHDKPREKRPPDTPLKYHSAEEQRIAAEQAGTYHRAEPK